MGGVATNTGRRRILSHSAERQLVHITFSPCEKKSPKYPTYRSRLCPVVLSKGSVLLMNCERLISEPPFYQERLTARTKKTPLMLSPICLFLWELLGVCILNWHELSWPQWPEECLEKQRWGIPAQKQWATCWAECRSCHAFSQFCCQCHIAQNGWDNDRGLPPNSNHKTVAPMIYILG